MAEQRVKCDGKMHLILWGPSGATFVSHQGPPDEATGCAKRVAEWAAEVADSAVAQWIDSGFRKPTEAGEWNAAGLGPVVARLWADQGRSAFEAGAWNSAGVGPAELDQFTEIEMTAFEAAALGSVGRTAQEAVDLAESAAIDVESAVSVTVACQGDPDAVATAAPFVPFIHMQAYSSYLEPSDYREALDWLLPCGLTPADLETLASRGFAREVRWMIGHGMTRAEMFDWTAIMPPNSGVFQAFSSGRSPEDALALRDAVDALGSDYLWSGVPYQSHLTATDVAGYATAGFKGNLGPTALNLGLTVADVRSMQADPIIAPWLTSFLVARIADPAVMRRWIAEEIGANAATKFISAGVEPSEARAWQERGYSSETAIKMRANGKTPASVGHIFEGEKWTETFSRVRGEKTVFSVRKRRQDVVHRLFLELLARSGRRSSMFGDAGGFIEWLDGGFEWNVPYGFGGSPMYRVHGIETFTWICERLGLSAPRLPQVPDGLPEQA